MKKIFIIIPIILLLICFYISLNTHFALAEEESEEESPGYKIEVSIPGGPTAETPVELKDYIKYIYIFGLSLIGIAALGVLVYGGLLYMLSDTVGSTEDAKKYIWAAISGLVLGLAAFLILNTINPDLTSLIPPELNDLSESKEPVKPTDCTDDASACTRCEVCVPSGIEEGKKICKNTCDKECATCEGDTCVIKEDGTECKEYTNGTCKDGVCVGEEKEKKDNGSFCKKDGECKSDICYLMQCVGEIPEDPCIKEGACVGTIGNCCSGICYKGKCVDCYPLGANCSGDGECCSGDCDDSNKCIEPLGA